MEPGLDDDADASHSDDGAKRFATTRRCPCGRTLHVALTGRPRLTCSAGCRRRRDAARRMLRRRLVWLRQWDELADMGEITRTEARRETRALRHDIRELQQRTGPLDSEDKASSRRRRNRL